MIELKMFYQPTTKSLMTIQESSQDTNQLKTRLIELQEFYKDTQGIMKRL